MDRRALVLIATGLSLTATLAACSSPQAATNPPASSVSAETRGAAASSTAQPVTYADTSSTQTMDLYLPSDAMETATQSSFSFTGAFAMGDLQGPSTPRNCSRGSRGRGELQAVGEALYPAGAQDVKAAVRYLQAHASENNLDPDKVAA